MRRKQHKTIQKWVLAIFAIGVLVGFGFSASAGLTTVEDRGLESEISQLSGQASPQEELLYRNQPKARAPEPATMALFGGGFLGMLAGFVQSVYRVAKRIFDICSALVGLILLAPVMLLAALAVKLTSKGPIIYNQVRVGKDGELFDIYKFRTMRADAEKNTGAVWATKNDSRITPIGKFLRKSRIDELPQLVNVLRGEMSLIGPRPERPQFVDEFTQVIPDYSKRLAVKPGITGLAQVWHRYDENIADVRKKVKYDLLYIKKMCLWADFNIVLRTFRVVLTGEGAK
ncbi:MAG: sugar transferase [Candidatus Omnitrophica bacterium]|nr:sugar transferase [Candidatus Omnitrophota bacterium]